MDAGMQLLNEVLIIFGISIIVLFICNRLKIPTIVGFLITGILAGPYGFKLINGVEEVDILSEIGVIFLLFTIGIEFSFKSILQIKKTLLVGGSIQVFLTIGVTYVISRLFGIPGSQSLFMGFLISLSSTAITLKLLQERAEVETPHGRIVLAIAIFQDIMTVPMMLLTPLIAKELGGAAAQVSGGDSIWLLVFKIITIIVLIIFGAQVIVPKILYQVAKTRDQELFLLTIILICLSVAWFTSSAGLSLALGAFLAGLIISESEYSHQALSNILPFKNIFTSFFFVSIGMLLNVGYLMQNPWYIISIALLVIAIKSFIAGAAAIALGYPLKTGILTGMALSQIGEFSFVLSKTGIHFHLLSDTNYQFFLSVSVITMLLTPFVIMISPRLVYFTLKLPMPEFLKYGFLRHEEHNEIKISNHIIIIGFGINGRNIAKAAKSLNIPYVVLEMNPETVKREKQNGEPIVYGDASCDAVLESVNINKARVMVIGVPDRIAVRRIIEIARRLNPALHIISRTRFYQEIEPLKKLGANEIIPEEFEASLEILKRVLNKYLVANEESEKFIASIRSGSYEKMVNYEQNVNFSDLKISIPDIEIGSFKVTERVEFLAKSIAESHLRTKYNVTLIAIKRNDKLFLNPGSEQVIEKDDLMVVFGSNFSVQAFSKLFLN